MLKPKMQPTYRHEVAISYATKKHQQVVKAVVKLLKAKLQAPDAVFFHEDYQAEHSTYDIGAELQNKYCQESELVVVFLCKEYNDSKYCRREWEAIAAFMRANKNRVMLLKDNSVSDLTSFGIVTLDGSVPIDNLIPQEIADLILKKHQHLKQSILGRADAASATVGLPIRHYGDDNEWKEIEEFKRQAARRADCVGLTSTALLSRVGGANKVKTPSVGQFYVERDIQTFPAVPEVVGRERGSRAFSSDKSTLVLRVKKGGRFDKFCENALGLLWRYLDKVQADPARVDMALRLPTCIFREISSSIERRGPELWKTISPGADRERLSIELSQALAETRPENESGNVLILVERLSKLEPVLSQEISKFLDEQKRSRMLSCLRVIVHEDTTNSYADNLIIPPIQCDEVTPYIVLHRIMNWAQSNFPDPFGYDMAWHVEDIWEQILDREVAESAPNNGPYLVSSALEQIRQFQEARMNMLIGPSGIGKSTLLRRIAVLLNSSGNSQAAFPILTDATAVLENSSSLSESASELQAKLANWVRALSSKSGHLSPAASRFLVEHVPIFLLLDGLEDSDLKVQQRVRLILEDARQQFEQLDNRLTVLTTGHDASIVIGIEWTKWKLCPFTLSQRQKAYDNLRALIPQGGEGRQPMQLPGIFEEELFENPAFIPAIFAAQLMHSQAGTSAADARWEAHDAMRRMEQLVIYKQERSFGHLAPQKASEFLQLLAFRLVISSSVDRSYGITLQEASKLLEMLDENWTAVNAEEVVQCIVAKTGFLSMINDRIKFSHSTIEVYFSAKCILNPDFRGFCDQKFDIDLFSNFDRLKPLFDMAIPLACGDGHPSLKIIVGLLLKHPGEVAKSAMVAIYALLRSRPLNDLVMNDPDQMRLFSKLEASVLSVFTNVRPFGDHGGDLEVARLIGVWGDPRILPLEEADIWMRVGDRDFYVMVYPITVLQYKTFLESDSYRNEKFWPDKQCNRFRSPKAWELQLRTPNHPVVGVSWYEAMAFCNWAGLSLPFRSEWEAVADFVGHPSDGFNCREAGIGAPTPVGFFGPVSKGCNIFDLYGNVQEWCIADELKEDPRFERYAIEKGGCFDSPMIECVKDVTLQKPRSWRNRRCGFRPVRRTQR